MLDLHDYVVEPMTYGRLFLAGDSAHLVAPIAAKGMNLALHDAFLLGDALVAAVAAGDGDGLDGYSRSCLRRVWDYQEFSPWLSEVYHGAAAGDPFRAGATSARLRRLFTSPAAAAAFAEQYLGTAERYRAAGQSCGGSPPSRWSATFSASSTRRRRCPSESE
ncbi:2-polyprenyl-6-methoxyphenol hydroxylase-like FAD-dependent oxidoreductase [Streptomyces sp. B4I13]|nr:2-polyprenyl-6-methoxyphenol hydroxylase-like FAD-dependent oxidoreductase [Streptomyces sp. B4I13]